MKKHLLVIVFGVCCTLAVMAQLRVESDGKTVFGGNNTWSEYFFIKDDVSPNFVGYLSPFSITRDGYDVITFSRDGGHNLRMGTEGTVEIGFDYGHDYNMLNPCAALTVKTWGGDFHGCHVIMDDNRFGMNGVRVDFDLPVTHSFVAYDTYCNMPVFEVDGYGTVYASGFYYSSDRSLKKNIEPIANSLDKVMKLQGLSFDYNHADREDYMKTLNLDSLFIYAQKRTPKLTREIFNQIQKEKSRKRMGVIAQDVEKVMPELVRTREDGLKAVAYPELVAVLIEAMKEQQVQIEKQQLQIEALQTDVYELRETGSFRSTANETQTTGIVDPIVEQCKLYQNAPNPFNQNTQIRFHIPENVQTAQLCIYDLQGKQIKQILITQRGEGSQMISSSELTAGMYLYSLIVDGYEVDTKRMILTK